MLFARARENILANRRFTAINLLERAIQLDPNSFELYNTLGWTYQGSGGNDRKALAAFEKAAAIDPDHLELQLELGRQYLAAGNVDLAVRRLRLALQTREYGSDEAQAALADFFLARALQQGGYDRAALDQYSRLLARVKNHPTALASDPRLAYLISDRLQADVGDLHARRGNYEEALRAYELAAGGSNADFDLESRVVRALAALGRDEEAARRAADAVGRSHASPESIALLREVYRKLGSESAASNELERLHERNPADRSILFALVDLLRADRHFDQAERILEQASASRPSDIQAMRRRVELRVERGDSAAAATLLIEFSARAPWLVPEVTPLWSSVLRPGSRLRENDLRKLKVSSEARASQFYWSAKLAEVAGRRASVMRDLQAAVAVSPPFAPAYRDLLRQVQSRKDLKAEEVRAFANKLISAASEAGDHALAAELRGSMALAAKDAEGAAVAYKEALQLGERSAEVALYQALALRAAGHEDGSEQLFWTLLSDHPYYEEAYAILYNYYLEGSAQAKAQRVLKTWLGAMPESSAAQVEQAKLYYRQGRESNAESILLRLLRDDASSPLVLAALQWFYAQAGHLERLLPKLEEQFARQPQNLSLAAALVEIYSAQSLRSDASRVLDTVRSAAAGDPEVLYAVAHLFARIEQKETSEQVLQQVLHLEPDHPPASNDLGYTWGEAGKNLDQAEALTRQAVKSEPDNQSFLDSLGWVLYKRGKFDEARRYLQEAIGMGEPDPVILDHMGDLLYRQGDAKAAGERWQQASERLDDSEEDRGDLKQLRLQLEKKNKQLKGSQPVNVAPVTETPARSAAAQH